MAVTLQETSKGISLRRASIGLATGFHAYGRGGRIRTGDHLNPIQVRYLAALRPETTAKSCLFCLVSLISWAVNSSDNLPLLSLTPASLASYFPMPIITSLAEPLNSPAGLESIQINKTLGSIHWLPALLELGLLIYDS